MNCRPPRENRARRREIDRCNRGLSRLRHDDVRCEKTDDATRKGHLNCLKRIYTSKHRWSGLTMYYAADRGHLDCLRYAYENGCEWDDDTTKHAAMNMYLLCLLYAHGHGALTTDSETKKVITSAYAQLIHCMQFDKSSVFNAIPADVCNIIVKFCARYEVV